LNKVIEIVFQSAVPVNYFLDQTKLHSAHSSCMHSDIQTLPIITVKILTAGVLNLYHTMFWNFKEDVCLMALRHI